MVVGILKNYENVKKEFNDAEKARMEASRNLHLVKRPIKDLIVSELGKIVKAFDEVGEVPPKFEAIMQEVQETCRFVYYVVCFSSDLREIIGVLIFDRYYQTEVCFLIIIRKGFNNCIAFGQLSD